MIVALAALAATAIVLLGWAAFTIRSMRRMIEADRRAAFKQNAWRAEQYRKAFQATLTADDVR